MTGTVTVDVQTLLRTQNNYDRFESNESKTLLTCDVFWVILDKKFWNKTAMIPSVASAFENHTHTPIDSSI